MSVCLLAVRSDAKRNVVKRKEFIALAATRRRRRQPVNNNKLNYVGPVPQHNSLSRSIQTPPSDRVVIH